jgi:hypothetical protein
MTCSSTRYGKSSKEDRVTDRDTAFHVSFNDSVTSSEGRVAFEDKRPSPRTQRYMWCLFADEIQDISSVRIYRVYWNGWAPCRNFTTSRFSGRRELALGYSIIRAITRGSKAVAQTCFGCMGYLVSCQNGRTAEHDADTSLRLWKIGVGEFPSPYVRRKHCDNACFSSLYRRAIDSVEHTSRLRLHPIAASLGSQTWDSCDTRSRCHPCITTSEPRFFMPWVSIWASWGRLRGACCTLHGRFPGH